MELSANSLLAKYYKFMYSDKLPKDFCTLFWYTTISVVFLPFMAFTAWMDRWHVLEVAWTSTIVMRILYGMIIPTLGIVLHFGGAVGMTRMLFDLTKEQEAQFLLGLSWQMYILYGFTFWLIVFAALALVVFCGWGIWIISLKITERTEARVEAMSQQQYAEYVERKTRPSEARLLWDTIRQKYCTKIEWVEKVKHKFDADDWNDRYQQGSKIF